jgi:hypothetical protein
LATYSANINVKVSQAGLTSVGKLETALRSVYTTVSAINRATSTITAPFQGHIKALQEMNRLLAANGKLLEEQVNLSSKINNAGGGGGRKGSGPDPRVLQEQTEQLQRQIGLLRDRARAFGLENAAMDKLRGAWIELNKGGDINLTLVRQMIRNARELVKFEEDRVTIVKSATKTGADEYQNRIRLARELREFETETAREVRRLRKEDEVDEIASSKRRADLANVAGSVAKVGGKAAGKVDSAFGNVFSKTGSAIEGAVIRGGAAAGVMAGADVVQAVEGMKIFGQQLPQLTGVAAAVENLLSGISHLPGGLGAAAVAAAAFAPWLPKIGSAAYEAGAALGKLEAAKPFKNVLTQGGKSFMEPLVNGFSEMNMEIEVSTKLVDALGASLAENLAASKVSRLASEFRSFSAGIDETISTEKAKRRNLDKRMRGYTPGTDAASPLMLPAYQERGLQQLSGGNINEVVGRMRTAAGQLSAVIEPMTTQVTAMSLSMKPLSDNTLEVVGALRQLGVVLENAIPIAQAEDAAIAKLSKDTAEFTARTDAAASAAARLASEWYKLRRIQKLNSSKSPDGGFPVVGGPSADRPLGTAMESPGFKKTKKDVGAFGENLALGAGFPLLFGAGPGSIAGSVAGSFMGSGFGGQILGGALGAMLDTAVVAVQKLGNAFVLAGDSYASIREQGVYFTAELEKQVNLAKAQGDLAKAQELQKSAMTVQTGDVGGLANTGATAAVNELQKAWSGVTKAVGTTLAILAAPFLFALDAILRGVQAIFMVVNLAITGIGNLINLIPGANQLGAQLAEQAQRGTVEYENQLAELDKQITSNSKNLELLRAKERLLSSSLTSSKAEQAITDKRIAATERLSAFEEELRKLRESAPIGTAELRSKLGQQEFQLKQKFALEEKAIALKDAREIYNAITDSNRNIKNQQRANELEYQDMVLQGLRAQQDFNLEVLRRVQDAKMRMREQELQYEQKLTAEQIKRQQLDNRQQNLQGSVDAVMSSDPERAGLLESVRSAISEWRTGRMSVEAEAAQKQKEIQLNFQKAQIAIERYKYDNAIKIARANEDSQNRIAKINEGINRQNDEVSRMQYKRMLESFKIGYDEQVAVQKRSIAKNNFYMQLADQGVPGSEGINTVGLKIENKLSRDMIAQLTEDKDRILGQFSGISVSKLTPMAKVPGMANTSAPASAAETAANLQLRQNEQAIAQLQKINGLKENDLKLAEQLLKPNSELLNQYNAIIKQQKDKAAFEREYGNLIRTGTLPEVAKELAELKIAKDLTEATYNTLIDTLKALPEFTNNPKLQEIVQKLGGMRDSLNTKAAQAQGSIVEGASVKNRMQVKADELQGELNKLADPVYQLTSMADLMGGAFTNAFNSIVTGSDSARNVFANMLKGMASALMSAGTQMIAMYVAIGVAKIFAGMSGGGLSSSGGKGFDMGAGINATGMQTFNPGNAFPKFAEGGVMTSMGAVPLRRYSQGGIANRPQMAMYGEGSQPEAFVPLPDGRRIPVNLDGGDRMRQMMGRSPAEATTPVLNMSFQTTNIGGVEYVSRDQLEQAMQETRRQATKDGAKRGMSMTLDKLQQSPSTRSRVGMR